MRSRKSAHEEVAEVARRRLQQLSAELAAIRPAPEDVPSAAEPDGSGGLDQEFDEGLDQGGWERPAPKRWTAPTGPDSSDDDLPRRSPPSPGRHAHRSVGRAGTVTGWLHDRLPATLQGRVRLGATHLTVLALAVAATVGATAWWLMRSNDAGAVVSPASATASPLVAVSGPSPAGGSAPPAAAGAGASVAVPGGTAAPPSGAVPGAAGTSTGGAGPGGGIVVDVAGKVRRPGIATLPLGSRVVDAIEAAGGARRGARLDGLNLARVLVDGEQVLVGVAPAAGVAASAAAAPPAAGGPAALVNINTASQAQLEELPGVGPVTAQAILAYRTDHGSFASVDQLLEVSGIGDATLAEIAPFVTL